MQMFRRNGRVVFSAGMLALTGSCVRVTHVQPELSEYSVQLSDRT